MRRGRVGEYGVCYTSGTKNQVLVFSYIYVRERACTGHFVWG